MCLQDEREALARWMMEANALDSFGMPTGKFTLVFNSDSHPKLARHVLCTSI